MYIERCKHGLERGLCKPTLETVQGGTCLLYLQYKPISLPPEDSQFLSTREFGVEEICRMFRVPPHLVQSLKHATFSNIEHQAIDFVQHSITPWAVRIEQAIIKDLLLETEQDSYFPKFNLDGLLRGDYQSRMNGYATGRQNGWMSANDIRELENLDRIPEEEGGDLYLINGNMTKLKDAGIFAASAQTQEEADETKETQTEPEPEDGRTRFRKKEAL